jgi:hypothetical protein
MKTGDKFYNIEVFGQKYKEIKFIREVYLISAKKLFLQFLTCDDNTYFTLSKKEFNKIITKYKIKKLLEENNEN